MPSGHRILLFAAFSAVSIFSEFSPEVSQPEILQPVQEQQTLQKILIQGGIHFSFVL